MVIISLSKMLLLIATLLVATAAWRTGGKTRIALPRWTPPAVLVVLSAFTLSLLWTTAPAYDAFGSLAKYGKLLSIIAMLALIRSRRDAYLGLFAFSVAQAILMFSSWLLYFGVPVPWATSNMALTQFAVFSSYLDQGIITAVAAAVFWHFRSAMPWRWGHAISVFIAVACIANVLFVLVGRTGHIVAIALVSLAVMWELPRKFRPFVIILPVLLGGLLLVSSSKIRDRLTLVKAEVQNFSSTAKQVSSSGVRLSLWHGSLEIIKQRPLVGSGVGSWSTEYNLVERRKQTGQPEVGSNFNPHQEYLLWGVQLGVTGTLLLLGLMAAAIADAWRMPTAAARAVQSSIAALAVACMFNSSIYDALIGDFFCVTIGLLLAVGLQDREPAADRDTEILPLTIAPAV